jgi:hypothetical protein
MTHKPERRPAMRVRTALLTTVALALAVFAALPGRQAHARPQYKDAFTQQYPGMKSAVEKVHCGVCHPTIDNRTKEKRNDYGQALEKTIGGKNVLGMDQIKQALLKIETAKSTTGPTFGELLKSGKLPGTNPE